VSDLYCCMVELNERISRSGIQYGELVFTSVSNVLVNIFFGTFLECGSSPQPKAARDVHFSRPDMTQTEYSRNGLSKMRRRQFIRRLLKGSKVCPTCIGCTENAEDASKVVELNKRISRSGFQYGELVLASVSARTMR